jgi:hypothetical protein
MVMISGRDANKCIMVINILIEPHLYTLNLGSVLFCGHGYHLISTQLLSDQCKLLDAYRLWS